MFNPFRPLEKIRAEVYTSMPTKFRKKGRTAWSDPNRQGADAGTQYRSAILSTNDDQKREAEAFVAELNASSEKGAPIVTEVKPLTDFFEAEDYHKDYYAKNLGNPYCEVVINPKLKKVQEQFAQLLARSDT